MSRDDTLIEIPQILPTPGFISRMEQRAIARKEKIKQFELIRQRKREEQKKKEELSRLEAEEAERKRQIQVSNCSKINFLIFFLFSFY